MRCLSESPQITSMRDFNEAWRFGKAGEAGRALKSQSLVKLSIIISEELFSALTSTGASQLQTNRYSQIRPDLVDLKTSIHQKRKKLANECCL